MPRGDGTGPIGAGPMSGRGAGYYGGFGAPGFMAPGPGRGFGRGLGFRAGRGRCFRGMMLAPWGERGPQAGPWPAQPAPGYVAPSREQEREMLQGQIEHLENALSDLQQRLNELRRESSGPDAR
jgi:hypothetical protein